MSTFLPPIEQPKGLMKKLAYYFTRKQFGKVLTPVKVHSARLPAEFGFFYAKIGRLDKKLTLPPEMVLLIRQRVAQINICSFCMDIGRAVAIKASMNEAKFDALDQYHTSTLFTDAERAALDYATELTKNKEVNPDTFARLVRHYSKRKICEIVWLVASEHLYNMTNIGLNIHSDMLCDIAMRRKASLKSGEELHQKLRQRILSLSGVTERQNAGIHEDAFFVGGTMFMHIHGRGHCDIRLARADQARALAEGKARLHRWAPSAGYVTFNVRAENDLEPAMELVRRSYEYFARKGI
jgi:alkylhydroperoxidase family enzyme